MSIFDKRVAFKPFEYPDVVKFKDSISHSYWLVTEFDFTSDVQDFHSNLNPEEKEALRSALLCISQVEVSVKKFWAKIGDRLPKPEIDQVGITFGESEVRHSDSYSHLLEILNLNNDFNEFLQNPVILGRIDYLTKYLTPVDSSNQSYTMVLALFSMFIENVSLFSQFLIIKSFNKQKNILKGIDNVVQATLKEEVVHALFGIYLINEIKQEFPEWFDEAFYEHIRRAAIKAYNAESNIIDWIFREGEMGFLPKDTVKEFIKDRFNQSITAIGGKEVFEVNRDKLKETAWFEEEIHGRTNVDFFNKRPTSYSKKIQTFEPNNLF